MVAVVMLFGAFTMAGDPKGCKIYHLNGTYFGESWTPSFPIKSLVTLALKIPTAQPWREINIEFESNTGANVGTLQLTNTRRDSSLSLKLSSMTGSRRTQTHKAQGHLKQLFTFEHWTYVNISAGRHIQVSVGDEKINFRKVNARSFSSLYVAVPSEQDLDVGFNCVEVLLTKATAPIPGQPEGAGMTLTVVVIVIIVLLICVITFWYVGRKRRNAITLKLEQDEAEIRRCEDCGDELDDGGFNTSGGNETSGDFHKDVEKERVEKEQRTNEKNENKCCEECGDLINDEDEIEEKENSKNSKMFFEQEKNESKVTSEMNGISPNIKEDEKEEEECSCSDEEHNAGKKEG